MKTTPTLLTTLGLLLAAPMLHAQKASSDPSVQPLLDKVAASYRNLKTLSVTVSTTQEASTTVSKFTFMKPNKLTATITHGTTVGHVISDGVTVFSDDSSTKESYVKRPYTDFKGMIDVLEANEGTGIGLLSMLLTSAHGEKDIVPGSATSLKKMPDATVGTEPCDVVEATVPQGPGTDFAPRIRLLFGKKDHLLRKLTLTISKDAKKTIVETYSNVTTSPTVADAAFHYKPLAGAKAVDPPKEPEMFDPRLKVGTDPFPVTGSDLDGKVVSLDQYKGKVLLLDFWATWCGPCVEEIPNVVAAYTKYHDKGFEVVGISLDQADSKEKVLKFTQEQKMPWRQIYDGKYWEAANAVAFGVHGIPFTLLIGKDGKIAAVGATGEELAPAIEAALKK